MNTRVTFFTLRAAGPCVMVADAALSKEKKS